MAGVRAVAEAEQLRRDAYANLSAVAWEYCRHADWDALTTYWGRERAAAVLKLAPRTVKKWVRWLRERGLLKTIYGGSTSRFRAGVLYGDTTGNLAAVYRLTVPAELADAYGAASTQKHTEHPLGTDALEATAKGTASRTKSVPDSVPSQVTAPGEKTCPPTWSLSERPGRYEPLRTREHGNPWPLHTTPSTKSQRLAACQRLRAESSTLGRLSARGLRHIIKRFFASGWTPADVLYAMDHQVDGSLWPYTDQVRHPGGYLRHRLAVWRDEHGQVLNSRSQRTAVDRECLRQRQRADAARKQRANTQRTSDACRTSLVAQQRQRLLDERAQRRGSTGLYVVQDGAGSASAVTMAASDQETERARQQAELLRLIEEPVDEQVSECAG